MNNITKIALIVMVGIPIINYPIWTVNIGSHVSKGSDAGKQDNATCYTDNNGNTWCGGTHTHTYYHGNQKHVVENDDQYDVKYYKPSCRIINSFNVNYSQNVNSSQIESRWHNLSSGFHILMDKFLVFTKKNSAIKQKNNKIYIDGQKKTIKKVSGEYVPVEPKNELAVHTIQNISSALAKVKIGEESRVECDKDFASRMQVMAKDGHLTIDVQDNNDDVVYKLKNGKPLCKVYVKPLNNTLTIVKKDSVRAMDVSLEKAKIDNLNVNGSIYVQGTIVPSKESADLSMNIKGRAQVDIMDTGKRNKVVQNIRGYSVVQANNISAESVDAVVGEYASVVNAGKTKEQTLKVHEHATYNGNNLATEETHIKQVEHSTVSLLTKKFSPGSIIGDFANLYLCNRPDTQNLKMRSWANVQYTK